MADVAPGCGEAEIDRSTRRHAVIESLHPLPQRQTPALLTANGRWFEMTGHRRDDKYPMSWIETIHETSVAAMEKGGRG